MTFMTDIQDVFDVIGQAAVSIFQSGIEINQDTMAEYLTDKITFARISKNKRLGQAVTVAFEQLQQNKGTSEKRASYDDACGLLAARTRGLHVRLQQTALPGKRGG